MNGLQIAVQRNSSGSPQLRVTEVYAEIVYTPQAQGEPTIPEEMQGRIYLPVVTKKANQ